MFEEKIMIGIWVVVAIIVLGLIFGEEKADMDQETMCVSGIVYFAAYDRGKAYPGSPKINQETGEYQRCK